MKDIEIYHNKAMDLADEADMAKASGDIVSAKNLYAEAFHKEFHAASLAEIFNMEPSHSILLKSAACLAFDASMFDNCKRIIAKILASVRTPKEILAEMTELKSSIPESNKCTAAEPVVKFTIK
ncbi:MAG: hypothetical protein MJZ61_09825 [Bacteroidales bacterium]|nr:hypothetical protein [Bacteroidales bacterium]